MGPSFEDQFSSDPLGRLITSEKVKKHGIAVVLNTKGDIYQRLWCCYELQMAKKHGVSISPSLTVLTSQQGKISLGDFFNAKVNGFVEVVRVNNGTIDTRKVVCGNPTDEDMIHELIDAEGGHEELNLTISATRGELFKKMWVSVMKQFENIPISRY